MTDARASSRLRRREPPCFKPETGGLEMTYRLEAQQYHQLTVGEKGMLSYKGSRFEGFTPDR